MDGLHSGMPKTFNRLSVSSLVSSGGADSGVGPPEQGGQRVDFGSFDFVSLLGTALRLTGAVCSNSGHRFSRPRA